MKTLFLNPNSSETVTQTLRRRIAEGAVPGEFQVRCLQGAPQVIASASDNAAAISVLARRLPQLAEGFDRVVLMSSLDSGYELASRLLAQPVFGFTRSVLSWRRRQGQPLHVVTFGSAMSALYDPVFGADGNAGVVRSRTVFEAGPLAMHGPGARPLTEQLGALCDRLHAQQPLPVFVVGAVALEAALELREQGRPWLVDPVADLLRWLDAAVTEPSTNKEIP